MRITFDESGIREAFCTCPYDWGGWCKHIVAVLLACARQPEQIEVRQPVDALLADLDGDQMRTLLLRLIEYRPELTDILEAEVQSLKARSVESAPQKTRQRKTSVDASAFRRRVRAILHSLDHMRASEAYWQVSSVVDQVRQVLDQAWEFIEAGDGENALRILEALTEEYVEGWTMLDDSDGDASSLFYDLGPAWTEALLTTDLTPEERREWADRLSAWQAEIDDYGVDDVFAPAQAAALQGWDFPPLLRVLKGEITPLGAWDDEAPWYADELAEARLNVLERQKRYQEYLYLAEAEGQMEHYLTMLARLGRVQQAVAEGMKYLATPNAALALAKALHAQGAIEEALRIAKHGLGLEGQKSPLARWLRDAAQSAGQTEQALEAALVAFREDTTLDDYKKIQELTGDRWPEVRADLLEHLRHSRSHYPAPRIEIFLHEGLIDDAIAAVGNSTSYTLVEPVVDAAIESRPDWAIRAAQRQAEEIMDAGASDRYHHAVRWLEKARAAYRAAGREAEWRAYLENLLQRHARKYKLVPMLKALR
ncbi:MAG: SWIM zinc finger domain-containing protein [Anaerolineae bacterium]|nr:MAG: SWIM zinc finger domain-containing protein [Anaerolineae bacterium]